MKIWKKVKKNSVETQKGRIGFGLRKIKIQYRLIAGFVTLLLISMILISSLVYIIMRNSVKAKAITYSQNIMQQVSLSINNNLILMESLYEKMDENNIFTNLEKSYNASEGFDQYTINTDISAKVSTLEMFNKAIMALMIVNKDKTQIGSASKLISVDPSSLDKLINVAKQNNKFKWMYYIEPGKSSSQIGHLILLKSIISKTSKKYLGTIIIEYDQKNISNIYNNINLGPNSEIFTMDISGKLISADNTSNLEKEYANSDLIKKINDNDKNTKNKKIIQVKIAGKDRLIMYSKVRNTDLINLATIPVSNFSVDSNLMIIFIALIGIICVVCSLVVATIVAKSITNPLKQFINYIKVVGKGKLAYRYEDSSKDEIGIINTNFSDMLTKVSGLIVEVRDMSGNVYVNASKIEELSKHSNIASEQVAVIMEEISIGAKKQADGVTDGVNIMEKLAEGINLITDKMSNVSVIINNSKSKIEGSINTIETLNSKSEETNQFSKEIISEINDLNVDMKEIKEITGLIMSISAQTNLLSLNAAIEAARAGEAGRGFSVIAEEVRNLAIQSKDASIKINAIINEVNLKTEYAVKEANGSTEIVNHQIGAVEKTNKAFRDMSESMSGVNIKIEKMKEAVENILKLKEIAMTTIGEIAAISEETSSSTENVSASTQEQIAGVQELAEFIMLLTNMSKELNVSIEKFTVS